MKRINIKCSYCGSQAFLRPASVVRAHAVPGEEVYVCARYPACNAYVSAHRDSHLPMGTLADESLRLKRRQAHIALNQRLPVRVLQSGTATAACSWSRL